MNDKKNARIYPREYRDIRTVRAPYRVLGKTCIELHLKGVVFRRMTTTGHKLEDFPLAKDYNWRPR